MRLAALALIGAFGVAAGAASASAAPAVPAPDTQHSSNIIQVWGGCGPGMRPVPGHWNRWGAWVPPHCAPFRRWGPYYGYGGYWNPYWRRYY